MELHTVTTKVKLVHVIFLWSQSWVAHVRAEAEADCQVRTLRGRRRRLTDIRSLDPAKVAKARRQAVNTIVQGTAADLLKIALIRLNDALPDGVRMLLRVHDSVLLELPEGLVEETRRIVIEAMEDVPAGFTVPLKVEVKTGRTWADCK
jgi:DNA polymerase-1